MNKKTQKRKRGNDWKFKGKKAGAASGAPAYKINDSNSYGHSIFLLPSSDFFIVISSANSMSPPSGSP